MDLWTLKEKFSALLPKLNERGRRMVAAAEAQSLGRGSIALVAKASGISYPTIWRGLRELRSQKEDLARIIHENIAILPKPVQTRVCKQWHHKLIRHSVILTGDLELRSRPHKILLCCNRAMKFMNKAG